MATSCEDILGRFLERRAAQGVLAQTMRAVRDIYNGDVVVPLPEREANERVAVANLMKVGLDQMADRVASTVPDVRFPVRRVGVRVDEVRSRDKRQAVLGWWDQSLMGLKLYRRGRHLLGYGTSPVLVSPDFRLNVPRWEIMDPLGTYPAPPADPDDPCVDDVIFAVKRSYGWLCSRYDMGALAVPDSCGVDEMFEVLRFVDDTEMVACVVGKERGGYGFSASPGARILELERTANRAGVCTAVVPGRINLDRRGGQFDGMIGMFQAQARLFALEMIAVEQGVFPDEWLISRDGQTPEIVQVADGRAGVVGMVKGGELRQQSLQPGYQTMPTVNALERGQRLSAGIPADFGGESASNVRTGRRGENILSATIDFTLLQAQRVLTASMEAENCRAIAVDKAYHDTAKSFYVSWSKAKGWADYTPSVLFDSEQNTVSYANAGTDVNGLVISGGQRVGMGTMSKRTFMEQDPLIDDPESEADRIVAETLEAAMASGIQMQASQGQIPPSDVARIMQLVRSDKMDLADAVILTQKEAQERQATPVAPDSPEAMPGIAQPGAGAESMPVPEDAGGPSVGNLSDLLSSLRGPQAGAVASEAPAQEVRV